MDISLKHILILVKKDTLTEVRQQYTFYGVLLYVASTVFIIYLSAGQPVSDIWNSLFWIIQLFVSINAVAKSFLQENKGRMIYYFSIAGARDFILSKLIFNGLLMLLMSLLTLLIFILLLGNPLNHFIQFAGISFLGAAGLSFTFTFLASIAAKAQQQAALMAIMGFPLIIPQLLLLNKVSTAAFQPVLQAGLWQMVLLLVLLNFLIIILAVILFPFLWKD